MTSAGAAAASPPSRGARRPGLAVGRLLRLELRRSTMLWMLPLLAVLLAVTELRNDLSHPPLWVVRSTVVQYQLELIGAVVAGVAAWTAGRDGRRRLTDLVTATAWPRWARQLAAWAAVTAWAMLLYAASVAVVFLATARQATWGGPIWWLPGVGAAAIVAFSAAGFAFGALLPGRFAAPLVAPTDRRTTLARRCALRWCSSLARRSSRCAEPATPPTSDAAGLRVTPRGPPSDAEGAPEWRCGLGAAPLVGRGRPVRAGMVGPTGTTIQPGMAGAPITGSRQLRPVTAAAPRRAAGGGVRVRRGPGLSRKGTARHGARHAGSAVWNLRRLGQPGRASGPLAPGHLNPDLTVCSRILTDW